MTHSAESAHSALAYFGTREELAERWVRTLRALLTELELTDEALAERVYPQLDIAKLRAVRAGDTTAITAHFFRQVCSALGLSAMEYFPRKRKALSSEEVTYWSERIAGDDSMLLVSGMGRPAGRGSPSGLSIDLYLYLLACREFDEVLK